MFAYKQDSVSVRRGVHLPLWQSSFNATWAMIKICLWFCGWHCTKEGRNGLIHHFWGMRLSYHPWMSHANSSWSLNHGIILKSRFIIVCPLSLYLGSRSIMYQGTLEMGASILSYRNLFKILALARLLFWRAVKADLPIPKSNFHMLISNDEHTWNRVCITHESTQMTLGKLIFICRLQ